MTTEQLQQVIDVLDDVCDYALKLARDDAPGVAPDWHMDALHAWALCRTEQGKLNQTKPVIAKESTEPVSGVSSPAPAPKPAAPQPEPVQPVEEPKVVREWKDSTGVRGNFQELGDGTCRWKFPVRYESTGYTPKDIYQFDKEFIQTFPAPPVKQIEWQRPEGFSIAVTNMTSSGVPCGWAKDVPVFYETVNYGVPANSLAEAGGK